jgi:hypothetical protein
VSRQVIGLSAVCPLEATARSTSRARNTKHAVTSVVVGV